MLRKTFGWNLGTGVALGIALGAGFGNYMLGIGLGIAMSWLFNSRCSRCSDGKCQ